MPFKNKLELTLSAKTFAAAELLDESLSLIDLRTKVVQRAREEGVDLLDYNDWENEVYAAQNSYKSLSIMPTASEKVRQAAAARKKAGPAPLPAEAVIITPA